VATDDLGGLGAKEGPGIPYAWVPPSFIPLLVPWLGVLLLLLLKANRSGQAWLIWLPLFAVFAIQMALRPALSLLPSEMFGMFLDVISALAFGLAAVWLTGHAYGPRHRLLGFLGMLGVMAGFGIAAAAVMHTADGSWEQTLPTGILLAFCILVVPAAMSLGGLCSRHQYRPAALFLWLLLWLPVVALVLIMPFFAFASLASGGGVLWGELLGGILILAGVCLGTLIPFLILSFANGFYRGRLQALLRLGGDEAPPTLSPAAVSAPE